RIMEQWASALRLQSGVRVDLLTAIDRMTTGFRNLISKDTVLQKAHRFCHMYDDPGLSALVSKVGSKPDSVSDAQLSAELSAAVERVYCNTLTVMKSRESLDQQIELTQRLLKTTEALAKQVRLRLQSVEDRLTLQKQMFKEDLADFRRKAADAVEIGMRDL